MRTKILAVLAVLALTACGRVNPVEPSATPLKRADETPQPGTTTPNTATTTGGSGLFGSGH